MSTIDEMWAAFEAHEPDASYADAWRVMLKERTMKAAEAAYYAAPAGSAAAEAAWWAGWALWNAVDAATADRNAQKAIDALREVKP
jgi:hypothetical protein